MDEYGRSNRKAQESPPPVQAKSERQSLILAGAVTLMIGTALSGTCLIGGIIGSSVEKERTKVAKRGKLDALFERYREKKMDDAKIYSFGGVLFRLKNDSPEKDEFCKKFLGEVKQKAAGPVWQTIASIESMSFTGSGDFFHTAFLTMRNHDGQEVKEVYDLSEQESEEVMEHFAAQLELKAK